MKLNYYIYSLMASVLLMFTACSPENFDLGARSVTSDDLAEGIAYTITSDPQNPNIIYLESKLGDNYTALWEHPQGRSQAKKVTLKIPFAATYTVTFGVETRGGVVYGEPVTFTVKDFCAEFVTNELWTMLTGGVGKSKAWVYDNGKYGYMSGEISYGDPAGNPNFGWNSFTSNWDAEMGHCGDNAMWESTMTFDLIGAANYSFYNSSDATTQKGLFSMNTDAYMMDLTDADLMHPTAWVERRAEWRRDLKIIELDENHLRIGYLRASGSWGGEWLEVFNYVSKEYADNYVPPVEDNTTVVPDLPDGWQDDVTQIKNQKIVWKLSADSPFDWCDLHGIRKNGFAKIGDYKEWCTPVAGIADVTLTLNSKVKSYKLELPDFTTVEGTYSVSTDGLYTFDKGLSSYLIGSDWILFNADENNQLRLMDYEMSTAGPVSDMWLGVSQKDGNGKPYQYLAYHFVAQMDSKQEVIYEAAMSLFDNSSWDKIDGATTNITSAGTYTATITGALSSISHTGSYGCYVEIPLILKDHPNATFSVLSIAADGNNITYDASLINTTDGGDLPTSARILLKNAWGTGIEIPDFATSFTVTFSVAFND